MFHCGDFAFAANFECANLASVVEVQPSDGCSPGTLCASCNNRSNKTGAASVSSSGNGAVGNFTLHLPVQQHTNSSGKLPYKGASTSPPTGVSVSSPSAPLKTTDHIPLMQFGSLSGGKSPLRNVNASTLDTKFLSCPASDSLPRSSHSPTLAISTVSAGKLNSSTGRMAAASHSSNGRGSCTLASTANPKPDYEFHLHTSPDCANTEYENNNRTWFYFSISGGMAGCRVRLRIMNLNKQVKLYAQGMRPVWQQRLPGHAPSAHWSRVPAPPHCWSVDGSTVLSWIHTVPTGGLVTFYAFTFPYSYTQLQSQLAVLDARLLNNMSRTDDKVTKTEEITVIEEQTVVLTDKIISGFHCLKNDINEPSNKSSNGIYYVRELVIKSLDSNRLDMLTVTSELGMQETREDRLPGMFPDASKVRPYKFNNKKIIFLSARVHPGETPSSFVFNGFLDFITSSDSRACKLRDLYVFKLIPMLNPDGVVRGHYRTDQRGVNLNRVYGSPSIDVHPTIYAAHALLLYYHYGELTSSDSDDSVASSLPIPGGVITSEIPFKSVASDSTHYKLAGKTSNVSEPPMIDEDTCHSFGDASRCQEAKHLGKSAASMEMDEPSASGWDISSNISVDSSIHTSAIFRVPDLADIHDDCSNISGVSEAETGVTSMFGALASVSSDTFESFYHSTSPKYEASCSKPATRWTSPTIDAADVLCHKCHVSKRSSNHKCTCIGPTTRSISKITSTPVLKPLTSITQQPALLTETNLKLHCSSEPFVTPFKSGCFLAPDSVHMSSCAPSPAFPRPTLPSFESSLLRESIHPFSADLTSSFSFTHSSVSPGKCASVVNHQPGDCSGTVPILSSSESEAEVGIPGKEGSQVPMVAGRPPFSTRRGIIPTHSGPSVSSIRHVTRGASLASTVEPPTTAGNDKLSGPEGGLHMYVDLHGHASKRGIFLYGNWFRDLTAMVDNLLLAKLLAMNCANFDFNACNFTEKNMTVKDRKNGLSKEGSGRVAIMRLTGLLRSYTLECNYNTGRCCNTPPPLPGTTLVSPGSAASGAGGVGVSSRSGKKGAGIPNLAPFSSLPYQPPKYTPSIFEECGRELAVSMLDAAEDPSSAPPSVPAASTSATFTAPATSKLRPIGVGVGSPKIGASRTPLRAGGGRAVLGGGRASINPLSRLPLSQFGSLAGVKLWLRHFLTSPSSSVHTAYMSAHSSRAAQGPSGMSPGAKLSPLISSSPLTSPRVTRVSRRGGGQMRGTSSPVSSPKPSPKQLRSKSQAKARRYSWTAVDAENREPSVPGTGSSTTSSVSVARSFSKFSLISSPKVKTHKIKSPSPKKSSVARSLMFTDVGEASCSAEAAKQISKVRSIQGLTSNVSITPNLSVKLSISDAPDSHCVVKKVEKVRRERSKGSGSSFKKLKTGCSQSRRLSQDKDEPGVLTSASASPRSPLSCVFQGSITDESSASSKAKIIKLPIKRRAKVSRTLSKCIVSKSLDILPSSDLASGSVMAGSSSCLTSAQSCLDASTTKFKVVRKKLKCGNSGSESDLSLLQASLPSGSFHWPIEQPITVVGGLTPTHVAKTTSSASIGKKEGVITKKKKRKIPGRKYL